ETFLRRYELSDPVLWEIAKVVHEADLADERYDAPEAPGLDVLLRGLSMVRDDEELLALSGPLFDGLYEYRKRALLTGREPARAGLRAPSAPSSRHRRRGRCGACSSTSCGSGRSGSAGRSRSPATCAETSSTNGAGTRTMSTSKGWRSRRRCPARWPRSSRCGSATLSAAPAERYGWRCRSSCRPSCS